MKIIKTLLFDFSRVLLHPTDKQSLPSGEDKNYSGSLNNLHRELKDNESYYLFNYFELNDELLEFLKSLKGKFEMCIFTTDIIQNDPLIREKIDPIFKKIYSANELGISKKDPESYKFIAKDLNKKPEEIFFTDDTESNLDAAERAGLETHLYLGNKELIDLIKTF